MKADRRESYATQSHTTCCTLTDENVEKSRKTVQMRLEIVLPSGLPVTSSSVASHYVQIAIDAAEKMSDVMRTHIAQSDTAMVPFDFPHARRLHAHELKQKKYDTENTSDTSVTPDKEKSGDGHYDHESFENLLRCILKEDYGNMKQKRKSLNEM